MNASALSIRDTRLTTIPVLISLIVLAVVIRAPGLGKWPLTVDEYYFTRAVEFIVEKGAPEFPDGGYYQRGIGLQYISALIYLIVDDWEAAVRIISLMSGVLAIPMLYVIARRHLGHVAALLCAGMLLLSSWHVEFSRFARMYAPFQLVFMCFVYVLYSGYWKGRRSHQLIAWALSCGAVFCYEGSIFMAVILLLAIVSEDVQLSVRRTVELLAVVAILFGLNYVVNGVDYRYYGVIHGLARNSDLVEAGSISALGPVLLPKLDLVASVLRSSFAFVYMAMWVGAIVVIIMQLRVRRSFWLIVSVSLAGLLPLFHQYGLLFLVGLVLTVAQREILLTFVDSGKVWIGYLFGTLLFWITYGLARSDTWLPGVGIGEFTKEIANNLIRYPRVYDAVIYPFAQSVPVWGAFAAVAIACAVMRSLLGQMTGRERYPLLIVLICVALLSVLRTNYSSTRYSFFCFPFVLLIGHIEVSAMIMKVRKYTSEIKYDRLAQVLVVLPFSMFILTEDFHLSHIVNVSSKDANFRMGEYAGLERHWYGRVDFASPARYVNGVYKDGDVIVIDSVTIAMYLDKPFVNFIPRSRGLIFTNQARKAGREEIWTGRPLISSVADLVNLVPRDSHNSLWLVAVMNGFAGGPYIENPERVAERNDLNAKCVFNGIDGSIGVWKINRK